ncbi:unnamed protein product [Pleuronectes platessa]|uniref:Uncharacterized protein n=1 Tax=Pleuronectes platessa TaxID=8262 RepID=A0A9N7UHQ3_PLEPL|nr:unnamed protein product [Pleuronectes platessa]
MVSSSPSVIKKCELPGLRAVMHHLSGGRSGGPELLMGQLGLEPCSCDKRIRTGHRRNPLRLHRATVQITHHIQSRESEASGAAARRPWCRPRTRRRSHLAWEHLGVSLEELENGVGKKDEGNSPLDLLP